ncbi:23S rRNA (pseudouridine(1915)-N(3))-methyltransferase RlmH [Aureicoccus marinus]|uniref:Ribosomal RNA large subunit methyltransferase H n=1 Tax=Aureicoccus marinus TaxID=754435 RepID=A0A2S7T5Q9_9FLAO|nr:23S rRNA (pseudouridine(1915)-N(3))-methyltransferase RlmH [Aureicoccus marinus]PQJ14825.1 23S rRNA (pseudouridine(1915)-N(3))-methyltransferase RlmH [Aureicoccus marinus]
MIISLLCVGKTDSKEISSLLEDYEKRLRHYIRFERIELPDVKRKNLSPAQQKSAEAELILKKLSPPDQVILLDEKGKEFRSVEWSAQLESKMIQGTKRLVFLVGGPYGFDEQIYQRADSKISLSRMTFSHQMVRLFFIEQLYRAFTIIRNEPYHHE